MKFSVVIPNYNSSKWINRLLDSIDNQSYSDYEVIIVDDMSTDGSYEMIQDRIKNNVCFGPKYILDKNKAKRYNGGSRNAGVDLAIGDYLLFADCDDYFYRADAFERIAKLTETNPDLIRLPYHYLVAKGEGNVPLAEPTLEALTKSVFVAPWTKCIKRELFVPFPENTLIEDVSQHIAQMDKIETMVKCPVPIIAWNCRNEESISHPKNESKSAKRQNSYMRILADLLDLEVTKPYCIEHKNWRIRNYIKVTKEKLEEIERRYNQ